ncbi:LysR family transcriptional regulator [Maribius pontilimi]|uniref:LysR family transcriptional regulator n=1 Tax=Palleronia pontilimi TaxID=1964209 RepID=A0A934IAW9_9RHOB|nr:LysR family transcriptional regulator [Palleronia pontilimi]MBJ3762276.1 LysR family transcriptional regulator [Palleronia pontilimi]
MKDTPSLDDLALFLAVADTGSLARAARQTGASVPTLSRRMGALETQLGRRLFDRGARGYDLTAEGHALAREMADLRAVSQRAAALADGNGPLGVRITGGDWTCRYLARHLSRWWSPGADWVPAFVPSTADLDIARRAADIGIRNRRPTQDWLAGRRTARVTYGIYAVSEAIEGFVTLPEGPDAPPSSRWVHAQPGARVVTTASTPRAALDLARAGVARIVLPTFVGDAEPMARIGPEIDDLAHEEWLVAHHAARNDPGIRPALDALAALLSDRTLRPG